ncbi:MaoC family dehydratase [Pseudonocardia acidicola]|uniref:MaoC family dehydratase n=1 Tax=Pseudonocardia acidicola TaxID=2724939 RepID=A0ABX1S8D6_9PSEU|nr:MaoC family dehydratase [Pseudonocardia acidicola]NMH96529.1 MaoC family dehydratase [Pseudonocardia acidicola]
MTTHAPGEAPGRTAEPIRTWRKGHYFEDFAVGQVYVHHWGRTILESDNSTFSSLTLSYHPAYFNRVYARELGHDGLVVNPMLVFLITFGMSVEDLSESGGAFLGVDDLVHHRAVAVGETLTACSTVVDVRDSASRPHQGIVSWQTEGRADDDSLVISFRRTNLIGRHSALEAS